MHNRYVSSDQSIDRVLNAGLPVALVFLPGPAPQALEQAMKAAARREAGKLLLVQIHSQDSPETFRRFGIQHAPALVALKDGQVFSKAKNMSATDLDHHVAYLLGRAPKPAPQAERTRTETATAAGAAAPQAARPSGAGTPGGVPLVVTDASFEQEVMRSNVPVVVDFWAPWCGPCRMVAPTLDKLAYEWNGRVKIAKVNVDENQRVAGQYGVTGIPTMLVVMNGKVVDRWAGALPEAALRSRLANHIKV